MKKTLFRTLCTAAASTSTSTTPGTTAPTLALTRDTLHHLQANNVVPWFASKSLSPTGTQTQSEPAPTTATNGDGDGDEIKLLRNAEGILSNVPKEQLDRTVLIYQKPKNPMQNSLEETWQWRLDMDTQKRWTNGLIGYTSTADPYSKTGLKNIQFDTLEEAVGYCNRMGFKFKVVTKPRKAEFEGKKLYAENFLNYHVQNRRRRLEKSEFAKVQFDHPERGKSCWVNLKHSDYGQDIWKQEDADKTEKFGTETWRRDSVDGEKRSELARRLGK